MGILDNILSLGKKLEDVRDIKLKEIEDEKIKETWYESLIDEFNVVRVVRVEYNSYLSKINYRNLDAIRDIQNTNHFSISNDGPCEVYDIRKYYHKSQESLEDNFRKHYSIIKNESRIKQLEDRYQTILSDYGIRMEAYKASLRVINPESQLRLNEFLNSTSGTENQIQHATDIREHSNPIIGNLEYIDPSTLNPYGGTSQIPESLLPEEMRKTKEIESEIKVKETKKRLESIE